jgi:hypothetical protein
MHPRHSVRKPEGVSGGAGSGIAAVVAASAALPESSSRTPRSKKQVVAAGAGDIFGEISQLSTMLEAALPVFIQQHTPSLRGTYSGSLDQVGRVHRTLKDLTLQCKKVSRACSAGKRVRPPVG